MENTIQTLFEKTFLAFFLYWHLKISTYFPGREMTSKTMNALSVSKSDATIGCAMVDLWGVGIIRNIL